MTVYSEGNKLSDVLLEEMNKLYSRAKLTLLLAQVLLIGTVVGKVSVGSVSETHAGNTGDGVMTLDATTPALEGAQEGDYIVKCIEAAAEGGLFEVFDPKDDSLGQVAVGDTFASQIKFVIADGATDFIVGDIFIVTVAAGTGKIVQLDPTASDGSEIAIGFLIADYDATDADVECVAIVRHAIAIDTGLVWPDGITADQKSTALTQLESAGIIVREGV